MRKQFITALATVLTSTMVTIPVQAARPNMDSTQQPFDPNATALPVGWTQEDANVNVGPIEEDTAIMYAFGGVDKYHASYEIVTPEYFKSVYADVAKTLQPLVDTTSRETIINSVAVAVNNHFTKDFNVVAHSGLYYGYSMRMYTDYVAEGRIFSSYEPSVLISTMLTANGVSNTIHGNYVNHNGGITVETDDGYYISMFLYRLGTVDALVKTTPPEGMNDISMHEIDMGAYEAYLR